VRRIGVDELNLDRSHIFVQQLTVGTTRCHCQRSSVKFDTDVFIEFRTIRIHGIGIEELLDRGIYTLGHREADAYPLRLCGYTGKDT
jgi:hypothetical protein